MKDSTLNRKNNCFDFLRLFAAFSVVIGHAVAHLNLSFLWVHPGAGYWFHDGVPLFFILSGFLVYRSCERCVHTNRPLFQYFINRYLRIAPGLYFYLVITFILLFLVGKLHFKDLSNAGLLLWALSTIAFIPVYYPEILRDYGIGIMNGSLWTIPAEFSFYLVIPLIVLFEKRFKVKAMMVLIMLASLVGMLITWGVSQGAETLFVKLFDISFVPNLTSFLLGVFWSKFWDRAPKHLALGLISLFAYLVLRQDILFNHEVFGPFWYIFWATPLSYFIIWFGYNAPAFLGKMITKIGDLSYGVYIWHMVVINTFIFLRIPETTGTNTIPLVILVTFLMAFISWWFIEKQALKLKPFSSKSGNDYNRIHVNKNSNQVTVITEMHS